MIDSFDAFVASRPELRPPVASYGKDLLGFPFYLEADTASGSVTNVDLTLQQAWYHDAAVRALFDVADSSTAQLRAILHIEGFALLVQDQTESEGSVKQALLEADPYVEYSSGGNTRAINLNEVIREVAQASGASTTATTTTINQAAFVGGGFARIPSSARINLENGSLRFKTLGDVGAAMSCRLLVYGAMTEIERSGTYIEGGNCGGNAGVAVVGTAGTARDFERAAATLTSRLNRGY